MTLPNPDSRDNGPIFRTPNAGRDERIARSDRETARRYREAALRLDREAESTDRDAELRFLQQQIRRLTDRLCAQRRARLALEDHVAEQADAIRYLHATRTEVSRNGTQTTR